MLCATIIIEVAIFRLATNDNIEGKSWIINLFRSLFALIASVQNVHDICTYMYVEMKKNYLRKHKILAPHELELRERPSSGFQLGVISLLGLFRTGSGTEGVSRESERD